jgi:branched-chain amino acid transport system substrate-binding protein
MDAYFRVVNDGGGIHGRKIKFVFYDDAYSPPKSVEAARRLVEGDEVLFIAGAMGTPGNIAVQKYMNSRKIPQIFLAAAASKLSDPAANPWTMVGGSTYELEGAVLGRYIANTLPDAKIATVYQYDPDELPQPSVVSLHYGGETCLAAALPAIQPTLSM